MIFKETWSNEQLKEVLNEFSECYFKGIYTKPVPYETWRKLKKHEGNVQVVGYLADSVGDYRVNIHCGEEPEIIYSAFSNDEGFGSFFFNKYIKEENDNMNTSTYCGVADSATSAIDTTAVKTSTYSVTSDSVTGISSNYLTVSTASYSDWNTIFIPSYVEKDEFNQKINELNKRIDNLNNNNTEEKEKMKGINFDFGPCGSGVRLSMYGLAVQNVAGEWVSYNTDTDEIFNVDILNFAEGGKYLYKVPVSISDVRKGDIVIHNRVPVFVMSVSENGDITAIDPRAGEKKQILLTKSPFGFNFCTKVVNIFGNMTNGASEQAPFGNMLPLLMMEDNSDMDPMMLFFLMGQNGSCNFGSNPMMLYFLMNDKDNKNILPLLMMNSMSGQKTNSVKAD